MQKQTEKKQLIMFCILFGIIIILSSLQVIFSTLQFVRVVSLIGVIGTSIVVGAFIREIFILKNIINNQ
ncbi:MAG: hypothetical protein ACI33M_08040 [Lysinibacillus sp.]